MASSAYESLKEINEKTSVYVLRVAFAFLSAAHSALYCANVFGSGVGSVSSAFVLLVFWVPVLTDLASLTLQSIELLSLVEALSVCSCGSDSLAVCPSEHCGVATVSPS